MEINKNIIPIGMIEGEGIVLLIDQKDTDTPGTKCVAVTGSRNEIYTYDNIGTPMTFNAFYSYPIEKRENYILILSRSLSQTQIEQINTFLINETNK